MKKQSSPDSSSFDMLLDTMCNTFGGICFIALLIAIISAALPKESASPEEAHQQQVARDMLQQLSEQERDLREAIRTQREANQRMAVRSGEDERKAVEAAVEVMEKLEEQKELLRREIEKMEAAQSEMKETESGLSDEIVRMNEADSPKEIVYEKKRVSRMPNERIMDRYAPHDVWLVGGRLYDLENKLDVYENLSSLKTSVSYTIRRGGGMDVTPDFLHSDRFKKMVTTSTLAESTDRVYLRIYADDRSFRELCMIRDRIVEMGEHYNWHTTNLSEISFRLGSVDRSVQ